MGYNRSGDRRKKRLKRHKKLVERLALKAAGQEKAPQGQQAAPVKT
jgi:hypothetical protein